MQTSISSLNHALQTLFFEIAPRLAKEEKLIKRQRCFEASSLLITLVLGWLHHPLAGPSQLARFAHTAGVKIKKQALDQRLTMQTAQWLSRVLQEAISLMIFAPLLKQGLLARFPAVVLEDASDIQLPGFLAPLWKGCGGSGSASALKLGVRFDLRSGQLSGPILQNGKDHETHNGVHFLPLPPGSLWIADAGYYALTFLRSLITSGNSFLLRPCANLVAATRDGRRLDLPTVLANATERVIDLPVRLGSLPRLWVSARLIALPVDAQIAANRREHITQRALTRGATPSATTLALAGWNLLVTNVAPERLTAEEALVLYRARWQIELLFKVWKSQGHIDEWKTREADHILCEVYAKLLAMLVEHWILLTTCFDDPHRSWSVLAELLRDQVPLLREGLLGRLSLRRSLTLLRKILAGSASIPARTTRPSTSHQLLDGCYWGLT